MALIILWMNPKREIPLPCQQSSEKKTENKKYSLINSLLRVIRNGIESKKKVDKVIDSCGHCLNMRTVIEDYRQQYETQTDPAIKEDIRKKGFVALSRYFNLILFQNYLDNNPPGELLNLCSFKNWLNNYPELETIKEELNSTTIDPLIDLDQLEPCNSIAFDEEVFNVVKKRRGSVLSQMTILKVI